MLVDYRKLRAGNLMGDLKNDFTRKPFVPFAPAPRLKPLGNIGQMFVLAPNPIETWTQAHFDLPLISGPSLVGEVIVVNQPEAIRHVLVDNAANYQKDPLQRRVLAAGSSEGSGLGLLSAEGDLWKRTRRTLAPSFTPRRVAGFAPVMRERAEARVDRWLKRRSGAILEIDREMTGVTYDILSANLFSDALAEDAPGFERELAALLDSIGRVHPFDILNAPKWLPRFGRRKARQSRLWFEGAISRLIEYRLTLMSEHPDAVPDDLLTALMKASDPETGTGLTQAEVSANLFTFIAAGHETTARALGWTLYLLARTPDWWERCAEEACNAPGDPAHWLEAMPAMRAAFEESMRLFPPVPMMSRIAGADDMLGNIPVAKGTIAIIAPWLIHRHTLLWDSPGAFLPERFLPGAREKIDRFAYLPFGAGPRVCIGAVFAQMEAMIVLTSVLRRVRLTHLDGEPRPVHRITLRPEGRLAMKMEIR